jgi:hypothetical protein
MPQEIAFPPVTQRMQLRALAVDLNPQLWGLQEQQGG